MVNPFDRSILRLSRIALVVLTPFLVGADPSGPPENPAEPVAGIEAVREAKSNVTYYYPRFDTWPQPNADPSPR